ncbi:hypothetical protein [Streptomyces sp. WG-D5]
MNDTTREVGSAIGIALMGSVFAGQYRSALPDSLGQLPAEAAESVRHSAAGGLEVATRMGADGLRLANEVRQAFMTGFTDAMAVVGVILVVAAAACLAFAPRRTDGSQAATAEGSKTEHLLDSSRS